jgi:hypothetical protein
VLRSGVLLRLSAQLHGEAVLLQEAHARGKGLDVRLELRLGSLVLCNVLLDRSLARLQRREEVLLLQWRGGR